MIVFISIWFERGYAERACKVRVLARAKCRWMAEWPIAAGCKPVSFIRHAGSNPAPSSQY